MVDSVKMYMKTKELFGWPEEPDEFPDPPVQNKVTPPPTAGNALSTESEAMPAQPLPLTTADK